MFFIPEENPRREELVEFIEHFGGLVSYTIECFSIQIYPDQTLQEQKDFYLGKVFSEKLLKESVKQGKFLSGEQEQEQFIVFNIKRPAEARDPPVYARKYQTIRELI